MSDASRIRDIETALARCIPWVATNPRGAAQEALAIACYRLLESEWGATHASPWDWTCHPAVLERRIALLPQKIRQTLERRRPA